MDAHNIRYAVATKDEYGAVRTLLRTAPIPAIDEAELSRNFSADVPPGTVCYVAKRRNAIVGAIFVITADINDAKRVPCAVVTDAPPGSRIAQVVAISVDRESRREGIATELIWNAVRRLVSQGFPIKAVRSRCNELYMTA